jgi:hypothetical protein
MIFPVYVHERLVQAGKAAIAARGSNGRSTKKHAQALLDLDAAILFSMRTCPTLFREKAWQEVEEKQRASR